MNYSKSFTWYKQYNKQHEDVFYDFFEKKTSNPVLSCNVEFNPDYQYRAYKHIENIEDIISYVEHFYSPHNEILKLVKYFELKYKIDYDKTHVLFYRGNDKKREMFCHFNDGKYTSDFICGKYSDLVSKAKEMQKDDTIYLIQSDESQFIA